jgi:hypothetical protein
MTHKHYNIKSHNRNWLAYFAQIPEKKKISLLFIVCCLILDYSRQTYEMGISYVLGLTLNSLFLEGFLGLGSGLGR